MGTGDARSPTRKHFTLPSLGFLVLAASMVALGGLVLGLDDGSRPVQAAVTVYDLAADWSDAANPNGPWSYSGGASPLAEQDDWGGGQPAWANAANGNPGYIPLWMKVVNEPPGLDLVVGDIALHSWDSANGGGTTNPANVT